VVLGDVFDDGGWVREFFLPCEVGACDLESVEGDGGSLAVDVSGGKSAEDVVEGELDGGAVVDGLHFEDAGASGERAVAAGAVVVVAEVLPAEGGRAAAAAGGVHVAAEVAALPVEVRVRVHGGVPPVLWR